MKRAERFEFERFPDLANERLGGVVLACNDEFFAPAGNLVKSAPAVFDPDRYTDRGKWMDGWETRRRRSPGFDWAVVRLGARGEVRGVVVDTSHFRGNHPEAATIEVCDGAPVGDDFESLSWRTVLAEGSLQPHHANGFGIEDTEPCTHVRLKIHPDGGVARLRVHGQVVPDWAAMVKEPLVDLAGTLAGGRIEDCSDAFFSRPENLLLPGRSTGMHDGWETRRRRGPGHDWVIVRLGRPAEISAIEVHTHHFKGNYPAAFSVDTALEGAATDGIEKLEWSEWVEETSLGPDSLHRLESPEVEPRDATFVRLNIYPDGGVARLRVFGRVAGGANGE